MTKNQIEYNKLLETRRANSQQEELTRSRDAENARYQQERNRLERLSLDETARSNLAREGETYRSNLAREAETYRANLARESYEMERNKETHRANLALESLRSATLEEQRRANRAQEALTSRNLDIQQGRLDVAIGQLDLSRQQASETVRANKARELETTRANVAKEEETNRANLAREVETSRHNKATEAIDIARAATYATDVAGRLIYYNKDHGTKIHVSPVLNNSSNSSSGNSYPNMPRNNPGGTKSPNPNTDNDTSGGNSYAEKEVQESQRYWIVGKTAIPESEIQQGPTFSQGGRYGGGASRGGR